MWVQEIEYLEKGKTKVYLSSGEIWMLYRSEIRQFDLQEETDQIGRASCRERV